MKHTTRRRARRFLPLLLAVFCTVFAGTPKAVVIFQPFHHFFGQTGNLNGLEGGTLPNPPLIQATDGNLYGTVGVGGTYGFGFIFRVTTSGALTLVYSFSGGSDGGTPEAALVQASDGNLYGTTADGGADYAGTVFRTTTNGTLATIYSFTGGGDGAVPETALVQAGDGNLYGAASFGGPYDGGTLFRITTNGALTPLALLYTNTGGDGSPTISLTLANDGNVYGTIYSGYNAVAGEVFTLSTNGAYTTLYSFAGTDYGYANGLVQASDGNLYGTGGGGNGSGAAFRLSTNGAFTPFFEFQSGGFPSTALVLASDGKLYGATVTTFGEGNVYQLATNGAQTYIYGFTSATGAWISGLAQASDGNLYGTTDSGGSGNRGTIFRINLSGTNGTFTLLDAFPSANTGVYPDGEFPDAGPTQGRDGNLYGSVTYGGQSDAGVIYRLGTNGAYTVLYSFTNGIDGGGPSALVQAGDGNLYGTTPAGGPAGKGTLFRVTTNGALTTLYWFTGGSDGASPSQVLIQRAGERFFPSPPLVQAGTGELYGTASSGGASNYGTIFQLTTNGAFTLIYTFTNGNDGAQPAGLVQDGDGGLYGIAASGGAGGNGTVFEIGSNGALNVLHAFTGGDDGAQPWPGSLLSTNGCIYGTTFSGGTAPGKAGTVFCLTTAGALTTLYSFTGGIDGNIPTGLAQGGDGNLYGITQEGGWGQVGTVFQISTNGAFSVIQSFDPTGSDGCNPVGSLLGAGDGNIYGTAQVGGGILGGYGTLFRVVITSSNAPLPTFQSPTLSAGNLTLSFQAAAGQSYFIQQSTNLATNSWTFSTNLVGVGSLFQLSVPATNTPAQFFRLREP